jgi:hypothetical protein
MGIEPTSEAWEASILPLYDARTLLIIHNYSKRLRALSGHFPYFPITCRKKPARTLPSGIWPVYRAVIAAELRPFVGEEQQDSSRTTPTYDYSRDETHASLLWEARASSRLDARTQAAPWSRAVAIRASTERQVSSQTEVP